MIQCDAFQPNAFQNDCVGEVLFQCDAFQLDAFQNDCEDLPEDLPARRRRRVTVIVRGNRIDVLTLEEEDRRKHELQQLSTDYSQALREDEDLLTGLWG